MRISFSQIILRNSNARQKGDMLYSSKMVSHGKYLTHMEGLLVVYARDF